MRFLKSNQIIIFVIMIILCLLTYINLPPQRIIFSTGITTQAKDDFDLKISIPKAIWSGQSEKILLKFSHPNMDQMNEPSDNPVIKNLEVNIMLNGAVLTPPGITRTPIIQNKDISLQWQVEPLEVNQIIGSIWVYILSASDENGSEFNHELIFTKNFSISLLKLFNLDIRILQILLLGVIFISLGIFLWKCIRSKIS